MNISTERLAEIQAALNAVPAPPWHWIGDTIHQGPMLATNHSGWIYVMGFARLGFKGAQPTFPVRNADGYLTIVPARDIEARETGTVPAKKVAVPRATYDPNTVRGINNPVARWLEHSPQYAKELLAEIETLRAKLDAPCGSCHPCTNYADETWRAAGRTPPHVYAWDELRAEVETLRLRAEQAERERDALRQSIDQRAPAGAPRKLTDEEIHASFLSSEEWKDSPTDRAARIYDAQSGGAA